MTTLTVNDLNFEVRWSERRQTLQITVDRQGELLIFAPKGCDLEVMKQFVKQKQFWIYTKLAEKGLYHRPLPTKQYVTGEGFNYLGRSYRLLLVDDQDIPLKLEQGRLKLRRQDADQGQVYLIQWYRDHAKPWLKKRIQQYQQRVGVEIQGIDVRDLGYRWGSCGRGSKLYFHWRTIMLPPAIIDYVVIHELVHLIEDHHTPTFWQRVERALPDFERRKQWLAENGSLHTTV